MAARKAQKEKPLHVCKECVHSYDWHEKNWLGELFMCRCPYHKEGKFSKFLDDPQCAKFELKNNGPTEQMG
jgi:hypothetical protein